MDDFPTPDQLRKIVDDRTEAESFQKLKVVAGLINKAAANGKFGEHVPVLSNYEVRFLKARGYTIQQVEDEQTDFVSWSAHQ